MFKRTTILLTALAVLASAHPAEAQQDGKVYRIGYMSNRYEVAYREEALREGLRELGYVEGKTLVIEWRFAKGKRSRLPEFAAELVRLKVDCIVTSGTGSTRAAKKATRTTPIPVVMANVGDPIGSGLVASLARPEGNVTGFTTMSQGLAGKRLELLKDAFPKISRAGLLVNQAHPAGPSYIEKTQVAARALAVQVQILPVRRSNDFEGAFHAATQGNVDALLVHGSGLMNKNRARIVDLAARAGLPVMYSEQRFVHAGGLMSYGPNRAKPYRRAATYIDKILKGTKPGDLPVQQPTKFDLVINMKTAKAAGISLSRSILLRATELIE
jgi:putative ABC transport system substrate-binding protein